MARFLILIFCILLANYSSAQPFRYSESIFQSSDTLKDIEFAKADWLANPIPVLAEYNIHEGESIIESRPLYMDIFTPRGDTFTKRPAIIFAHSGAFLIGNRKNDDMIAMCDSFARRGYVTATMDYRRGMGALTTRFFGILIHVQLTKESGYRATYRATQDSRAAIRFLKHNADEYGIDTTKIYLVGSSAGAIMSLYNVYLDKAIEVPQEVFYTPSLGNLDSIGIQGYGSEADGVVSLWGAIEKTSLIENDSTPVFLVHGKEDNIVPFKKGVPLEGLIEPSPLYTISFPEAYGSFCIDTALNTSNIVHESYFVDNQNHEFYGVNTGQFPPEGPNEYWDTIQWKMSNFLLNIFRPISNFEFETNDLTVHFTNTSTDQFSAIWDFGDGMFGDNNSITHTYNKPGNYAVFLKSFNRNLACDTITKMIRVGTSAVVNKLELNQIKVYPNPVLNQLNLEGISKVFNAKIYNIVGQVQIILKNSTSKSIEVNHLQNGIYILEIETNGNKFFRKFIKEN